MPNGRVRRFAALTAAAGVLSVSPISAHQRPIALEQWGPFLPGTVVCLRRLGDAARRCFDSAVRILDRCESAAMHGEPCDLDEVEEQLGEERAKVHAAIIESCQPGQLTELQYPGGVLDAQADHSNTCREQAAATMSMTYAPAARGSEISSPEISGCVTAVSAYARKVARYVIRRKGRIMERIGARLLSGSRKVELMNRIGGRLAARESRWAAGLLRVCPDFDEIYGRSAAGFVRTLKDRADCVLTATHGNNSLICIPQVCPNGVPEAGEECDDGNLDDTDACGNDCRIR